MTYLAWNDPTVENIPADEPAVIAKGACSSLVDSPPLIPRFSREPNQSHPRRPGVPQRWPSRHGRPVHVHGNSRQDPRDRQGRNGKSTRSRFYAANDSQVVSDDVPAAFKQSMFATAGTYPLIMRCTSSRAKSHRTRLTPRISLFSEISRFAPDRLERAWSSQSRRQSTAAPRIRNQSLRSCGQEIERQQRNSGFRV